jgi:hypothetical protein
MGLGIDMVNVANICIDEIHKEEENTRAIPPGMALVFWC